MKVTGVSTQLFDEKNLRQKVLRHCLYLPVLLTFEIVCMYLYSEIPEVFLQFALHKPTRCIVIIAILTISQSRIRTLLAIIFKRMKNVSLIQKVFQFLKIAASASKLGGTQVPCQESRQVAYLVVTALTGLSRRSCGGIIWGQQQMSGCSARLYTQKIGIYLGHMKSLYPLKAIKTTVPTLQVLQVPNV